MSDPKSLVEFIMEAINEVAPGRGREIYHLGFNRWCDYTAAQKREADERELVKAMPLLAREDGRAVDV